MRPYRTLIVAAAALTLAACQTTGNKQTAGMLVGGAVGGLLGSTIGHGSGQLVATAAGTFVGALVGSEIGRGMDRTDRLYAERASHDALETAPTGGQIAWNNPDSGNHGSVTPTRTYQTGSGQYCREYQQTVVVGGETQHAYGTACRQPDGSWRIED